MSEEIILEVKFFLISIFCGIFLLVVYDCLRILRRIVHHSGFLVSMEDLLFWTAGGFFIFHMAYQENYGIIRSFSIGGLLLGMVFYHNLLSDTIVEGISFLIHKVLWLIGRIIGFITAPIGILLRKLSWMGQFIGRKLSKPIKYFTKALKKKVKTVKIAITKK